jgi:hypothetical protein
MKNNNNRCSYCKDGLGIIFQSDLESTIRMEDGTLKCHSCVMDDYKADIVKNAPYSPQARQIVEDDKRYVDNFNQNAEMINKSGLASTPIKKKQYRYRHSILNSIENKNKNQKKWL